MSNRFRGRNKANRICKSCGAMFAQDLDMTKRRFCATCREVRDRESNARAARRYYQKIKCMTDEEWYAWQERHKSPKRPDWAGDWDKM